MIRELLHGVSFGFGAGVGFWFLDRLWSYWERKRFAWHVKRRIRLAA